MLGDLFTRLALLLKQHDGICYTLQGHGEGCGSGCGEGCGSGCGRGVAVGVVRGVAVGVVRGVAVGVALDWVYWEAWHCLWQGGGTSCGEGCGSGRG